MEWIKCSERLPQVINETESDWAYSDNVLVLDNKNDCWVAQYCLIYGKYSWIFKKENDNCCDCVCPTFVENVENVEDIEDIEIIKKDALYTREVAEQRRNREIAELRLNREIAEQRRKRIVTYWAHVPELPKK